MSQRDLLDEEHVVRQCSRQRQTRGEGDELLGITHFAFELRPTIGETYLSLAWLEYFGVNSPANLVGVRDMWIDGDRAVKPKDVFAVCNAGQVRQIGEARQRKLRVRHEPASKFPAYATIRGLPVDNSDQELLQMLVAVSVVSVTEVQTLP